MPSARQLSGPTAVAVTTVAMLLLTWQCWTDPLIDYGTHLYVPWRLSIGQVLYRDVELFNGPVSSYVDAGVFRLLGVGIRSLEIANGLVLIGAMTLCYRLALRTAGVRSAVAGGLTIATVFAFGQGVGIGNYNWMTPYAHELTHGVLLGLFALACCERRRRTGRLIWAAFAGVATGLCLMTKVEPAMACVQGVLVAEISSLWETRASGREAAKITGMITGFAVVPIFIAIVAFARVMPISMALRGVAGSWVWALDSRITSLPFYKGLIGLDAVPSNILRMLACACAYAIIAVFARALGGWAKVGQTGRLVIVIVFVTVAVIVLASVIDLREGLRALPVVLLVLTLCLARSVYRREPGAPLRLALVVFSLALLGKLALQVHAYHYGFAMAMPATLVLVALAIDALPKWTLRRGGNPTAVVAVVAVVGAAFCAAAVDQQQRYQSLKRWTIRPGTPDEFRGSTRGLEVSAVVDWIDRQLTLSQTVAVLPEGLMINYLSRRGAPVRCVNFMPPELLTLGETGVLASLKSHPPDAIVLNRSAINGDAFTQNHQYAWGRDILRWVHRDYRVATTITMPLPVPTFYGLEIWVRREKTNIQN